MRENNGKLRIQFYDQIFFDSGSDKIKREGRQALKNFAKIIENEKDLNINIVGHTDSVPVDNQIYNDNWDLSVARAASVTRFLQRNGISPDRLTASGKSKFDPLITNTSESTRQFNRRTEIVIVPDLDEIIFDFLLSQN